MKKIVTLLIMLFLMFASCSKDDENSQNQESIILPKKIIKTEGVDSYQLILSYNGNKILEVNNSKDDYKYVYTYTGDLITKKILYKGTVITNIDEYNYDNGIIKNVLITKNSTDKSTGFVTVYKSRTAYINNADGTITEQNYSIDSVTGIETKLPENRIFTFVNGNLVKEVRNSPFSNSIIYKYTYLFEYDDNKNPYKNILGLNKIGYSNDVSSINNVKKFTTQSEIIKEGTATTKTEIITVCSLQHNKNTYLTESKYSYSDGNSGVVAYTTQYFYE
jgi:hypothetical protein